MYFVVERQQLRLENVTFFRRSIKIFGEFFHKGRLVDGRPLTFLAEPLVRYLEMLLEFAEPEDLELFTVQVGVQYVFKSILFNNTFFSCT